VSVLQFRSHRPPYRWLEYLSFGPWLARCRSAQLVHLTGARHALLLREMGMDAFWRACWQANPTLTADVVDSSHSMLQLLDRRIRRSGPQARQRICLHHADALQWNPTGSYDLIVSHFFLDCFFPGINWSNSSIVFFPMLFRARNG
jgi:hypothetical protein